jgi:hypothetical protein
MAMKYISFTLLLLCGCSGAQGLWTIDSISTGEKAYDIARIRYAQDPLQPLGFEITQVGDRTEAFLSLSRFRLEGDATIFFTIGGQTFEELAPVHEGGMRLRLSTETTGRLIQALQDGQKVAIVLDDFEELLDPEGFIWTNLRN